MNPICIEEIDEPLPEPPPAPELNRAYPGDCLATMKTWPGEIVDCIVTSPPYYKLRSYLPDGHPQKDLEIGHKETLDEYIDKLVRVFRESGRLLKSTGVLCVNIGDTYDSGQRLGVPHRLAFALQEDGWRWVDEIIWYKPNCMPGSYPNRTTPSHEPLFVFARSMHHYFDWYAAKEDFSDDRMGRDGSLRKRERNRGGRKDGFTKPNGIDPSANGGRHPRSVWSIPTVSLNGRKLMADFKDEAGVYREIDDECPSHGTTASESLLATCMKNAGQLPCICMPIEADFFAAMPPALAAKCIALSTSEVGNCSVCGAPYRRVLQKERVATRPGRDAKADASGKSHKDPGRHITRVSEGGWEPSCDCSKRNPEADRKRQAAVVFDPFLGSGTTAVAATLLDRDWLGCELNEMLVDRLIPARLRAAAKGGTARIPGSA